MRRRGRGKSPSDLAVEEAVEKSIIIL